MIVSFKSLLQHTPFDLETCHQSYCGGGEEGKETSEYELACPTEQRVDTSGGCAFLRDSRAMPKSLCSVYVWG